MSKEFNTHSDMMDSCVGYGMKFWYSMLTMCMMIMTLDVVWGADPKPEVMQQPNPLVGMVMFALLYYGCYRRWPNQQRAASQYDPDAVRAKAYDKTRWFVYIKVACSLAITVWWILDDRNEDTGYNRDVYVVFGKSELILAPLLLLTLNRDCAFEEPHISTRMRIKLSLGYPIFIAPAFIKLVYNRWNKPYGRNTRLVVFTTRLANITVLLYLTMNIGTILGAFLFPLNRCSQLGGLMVYLQSMLVLFIILPVATTCQRGLVVSYDPVFFLSLVNTSFAAFSGLGFNRRCFVCTTEDGVCSAGWNLENWDRFSFPDILTAF